MPFKEKVLWTVQNSGYCRVILTSENLYFLSLTYCIATQYIIWDWENEHFFLTIGD